REPHPGIEPAVQHEQVETRIPDALRHPTPALRDQPVMQAAARRTAEPAEAAPVLAADRVELTRIPEEPAQSRQEPAWPEHRAQMCEPTTQEQAQTVAQE